MNIPPDKPVAAAAREFDRAWQKHFKAKKQLTIERLLVWVYKDQRVIEISGKALTVTEAAAENDRWVDQRHISGDGCFVIEKNSQIGCAIDGGGPIRGLAQPLHPDAETTHDIVMSLPWHHSGRLISYGRGLWPAPELPGLPRLVKIKEFDGRRGWVPKVISEPVPGQRYTLKWCPVTIVPDQRDVDRAQMAHQAWLASLGVLRTRLSDIELRDHQIVEPNISE